MLPKAQPPLPGPMPLHNAWEVPGPRPHSWYVAEQARPRKPSSPGWNSKAPQGQGQPHPRPVSRLHSPSVEPQPSAWSWTHGLWRLDSRTGTLEPWVRPACPSPPPAPRWPNRPGRVRPWEGNQGQGNPCLGRPCLGTGALHPGGPHTLGFALSSPPASLQPPWRQPLLAGRPPAPGPSAFPRHPQQVGEGSVPGSPPSPPLPHLPG